MRMSIGVPGLAMYFEHDQVKPFIKNQAVKLKSSIDKIKSFTKEGQPGSEDAAKATTKHTRRPPPPPARAL